MAPNTGWRRLVLRTPSAEPARPDAASENAAATDAMCLEHGVEMNGRLAVERPLRIEGELRGELESTSSVLIAESGAVVAPIRARSVEIHGAVVGDVVASREVVIHATGRLHGDVETPSLVIERGATFNGRTRMYRPERELLAIESAAPDAAASHELIAARRA
jgi:cytoskeletal protein CcmA (bactofilin family)